MKPASFEDIVTRICEADGRYDPEAYYYMRDAIGRTVDKLGRSRPNAPDHHVTGQELSEGFRDCFLEDFGPLGATIAEEWGIAESSDLGAIVYNLIEAGAFAKSPQDKRSDFDGVFNLIQALEAPFRPNDPEGFERKRDARIRAYLKTVFPPKPRKPTKRASTKRKSPLED